MLAPGSILDGYSLIRPIGRGGFGEVWLCRLGITGEFKALKFLPASDPAQLKRELEALIRYRAVVSELQCPQLVPIEHVNRAEDGLFYLMPLADGLTAAELSSPDWQPKTLAALLCERRTAPAWFSPAEIRAIMSSLVGAVERLSDAGVVHRDIKPENILFIGGRPCLGDVSLLTEDAANVTRRGTPGYAPPSWYLESGGNPDLWGLATTLYSLVTGNAPDKLGRAAFLWPPQGESAVDAAAWSQFHRIILRATHEQASERYLRLEAFAAAISETPVDRRVGSKMRSLWFALAAAGLLIGGLWCFQPRGLHVTKPAMPVATPSPAGANPTGKDEFGLTKKERADYQALAFMSVEYMRDGAFEKALTSLDTLLATYEQARKNPTYHSFRAECLLELGRFKESMDAVNRSLMIKLDPSAFEVRIMLWKKLGDLSGAEADATTVINEFKPYSPHFFQRAEVRILRNNFAGAEEDLRAAERIDNDPDRLAYVATMRASLAKRYPEFGTFLRVAAEGGRPPVKSGN